MGKVLDSKWGTVENGINITVGPGEFIDRLTILRLKQQHARTPDLQEALASQVAQFTEQRSRMEDTPGLSDLEFALSLANRELWQAENEVRRLGAGPSENVALADVARRITEMNDDRARVKAEIDRLFGWPTTETKIYGAKLVYDAPQS